MKLTKNKTTIAIRRVCLLCVGLAAAGLTSPALADGVGEHFMAPIVVETQKSATLPELAEQLADERLVYVGETHTAYADHLMQLEVLRGMASRPQGLALGVEWFQSRFQPVLDDYLAGRIDEAEMLRRSEYYDRWRFDYRLYRPIIRFARDNGIPIIALNASAELTSAIRRKGINELPAELRKELPDSYDVRDKQYEALLRETFRLHDREDNEDAFRRFVEVQLTWDESMAQRVAAYLQDNPDGRILVLAGRGHIGGRSGIPNRVSRRTGLRGVTIGSYSARSGRFNSADFLVLAQDLRLPPPGLMRVLLDTRDEGVFVKGFTNGSPAEEAGFKTGDRLLTINGVPIRHYADVKIAMIDQRPGNEVEVTLRRDSLLGGDRTLSYRFELAGES